MDEIEVIMDWQAGDDPPEAGTVVRALDKKGIMRKVRVTKNGGGYDLDLKHFTIGPGHFFPNEWELTTERSRELLDIKYTRLQERFEERVVQEFQDGGINVTSGSDALALAAAKVAKSAHDNAGDKPKDSAIALEKVAGITKYKPSTEAQAVVQSALQINVTISPEIASRYLESPPDVLEGDFTE